jgi:hypothetical protein
MRTAMISEHANPLAVLDEGGQNLHVDGPTRFGGHSWAARAGTAPSSGTRDSGLPMSPRCIYERCVDLVRAPLAASAMR